MAYPITENNKYNIYYFTMYSKQKDKYIIYKLLKKQAWLE